MSAIAPRRRVIIWSALALGTVFALLLDSAGFRWITLHDRDRLALVKSKDWYELLRLSGYLPTWILVGLVITLAARARGVRDPLRSGVVLVLSATLSGAAAEVLKVIVGRMRPEDTEGALRFMALGDRLKNASDLSMPSSHAAVAFGAAIAAGWIWRGTMAPLLALAAGCGLTRVIAGGHFVSDVYVAAVVAYALAGLVWRIDARNNPGIRADAAGPRS